MEMWCEYWYVKELLGETSSTSSSNKNNENKEKKNYLYDQYGNNI